MPMQADITRPIRTLDTNGKIIATETEGKAAEIKTVDKQGRQFDPIDVSKIDNPLGEIKNETVASATATEQKTDEVKNTDGEARKLFLQAQKAERKAKEMEKKAKEGLAKAEAIEAAIKLTESGSDPTALLKAAGVDPIKFYKDMTTYALSDKGKPEDPVQKELREHKERLDKYAKDLEVQASTIKQKEDIAMHNQAISTQVIPFLQQNADKYEALIMEYGANAAVKVYEAVWEKYQADGTVISFKDAADFMENYWSEQIESGIKNASKMKKYQKLFAQQQDAATQEKPNVQQETPNRTVTLSNKQSATTVSPSRPVFNRQQTREERIAEIVAKYK